MLVHLIFWGRQSCTLSILLILLSLTWYDMRYHIVLNCAELCCGLLYHALYGIEFEGTKLYCVLPLPSLPSIAISSSKYDLLLHSAYYIISGYQCSNYLVEYIRYHPLPLPPPLSLPLLASLFLPLFIVLD